MFFGPVTDQLSEIRAIENGIHGLVGALPKIAQRRIGLPPQARPLFLAAFDETQNVSDADGFGPAGKKIAALRAAPRFDETALLEAGEDQLEEFLGNLLTPGDIGDSYRVATGLGSEIEDGMEGIFTLDGDIHRINCPDGEQRRRKRLLCEKTATLRENGYSTRD